MPSSQVILDGLRAIANTGQGLAVMWHVAFGAGLAALVLGWRPAKRLAGALFATPPASVSALAWLAGNPFNGTVFAILAVGLAGQGVRLPHGRVAVAVPWLVAAGGFLTAFGWIYPHFLEAQSLATYLYAAPLGLVPCPTLSALVGVALVIDGLGARWWSMTLAIGGAAYGLIGWLRLGVTIDVILLAGAVALGIVAAFRREPAAAAPVAGA
jgi:hypothetical protein